MCACAGTALHDWIMIISIMLTPHVKWSTGLLLAWDCSPPEHSGRGLVGQRHDDGARCASLALGRWDDAAGCEALAAHIHIGGPQGLEAWADLLCAPCASKPGGMWKWSSACEHWVAQSMQAAL